MFFFQIQIMRGCQSYLARTHDFYHFSNSIIKIYISSKPALACWLQSCFLFLLVAKLFLVLVGCNAVSFSRWLQNCFLFLLVAKLFLVLVDCKTVSCSCCFWLFSLQICASFLWTNEIFKIKFHCNLSIE